jgi:hypothetical protein
VWKSNPIICATSVIFAQIAQSKQSPIGRKFVQSGRPARNKWETLKAEDSSNHLKRACRKTPARGDQMSFWRNRPKCSPTHFLPNLINT